MVDDILMVREWLLKIKALECYHLPRVMVRVQQR